jgi:activating signal cointegrator 1
VRGLSLTQPWASLIALGAKQIETRSWSTSYRGRVAIHAAKNLEPVGGAAGLVRFFWREPFASVLRAAGYTADRQLPRGVIVATARLADVVPTDPGMFEDEPTNLVHHTEERRRQELAFGDYSPGRYAWLFRDVAALPEPIEIPKGAVRDYRGLWELPDDLAARL